MKKISILFLAFTAWATAQQKTGINTTTPQATFDVTAKTENNTNEVEGLLIPRVSKQKALNMTANPITESTMIYVNDLTDFNNPADGTEAKVAEITENGFYHWNGIQWVKDLNKDGSEWGDETTASGKEIIYAKQAREASNDVVITDDGKVGIGTNKPNANLSVFSDNSFEVKDILKGTFSSYTSPKSLLEYKDKFNDYVVNVFRIFSDDRNTSAGSISGINTAIIHSGSEEYNGSLISGYFNISNKSSGIVNRMMGLDVSVLNYGEYVNSSKGINIRTQNSQLSTKSENIVNQYGLFIEPVKDAQNNNYAIYTNAGLNSFGDDVQIRNINSQISTDPNHKVVVADADGTLRVSENLTNNNSWTLNGNAGTDPDNNFIGTTDNKALNFGTYGSNKMTILPDGRVGIGTDNPNCLFEIKSKAIGTSGVGKYSDITYTYYMGDTDYSNSDPMTLFFRTFGGTENNPKNLKFYSYLYDLEIQGYVSNMVENLTNVVSLYKGDGNTIKSDYTIGVSGVFNDFHIHEDHNIGIGTLKPTAKLDVNGNAKFLTAGSSYITGKTGTQGINGSGQTSNSYHPFLRQRTASGHYANIGGLGDWFGFVGYDKDRTVNGYDYTLIMNLNNGNIGIGTTNPTQKLHVMGNILASGSITPDYVFEKYYTGESKAKSDYQMLSLTEIENYTKTNKHLPGVPSAQEIKEQGGILVNKATEINLEKIEELYLHTIVQEKELKEKDEKIKNLETRLEKLENLFLK